MTTFINQLINGLTQGSLFALIALGYTMVYGVIGLINFAHGDLFMLGGMLSLSLATWLGLTLGGVSGWGAAFGILTMIVLAGVFCGVSNVAINYLVYRPLRNSPKLVPLVSAIGVSFVLVNIGQLFWGTNPLNFPALVPKTNLLEGTGLSFMLPDLLVISITVPLMIGLTLLVRFTKLGKAMRAVEQDQGAAQLMGINTEEVITITFFVGGALAGAASVIYGIWTGTVKSDMGFQNGLFAFTAAVVGGIGSLPGAVLGGLIIGLVIAFTSEYLGARWSGAVVFSLLIVVLIFRPAGLLGETAKEKV